MRTGASAFLTLGRFPLSTRPCPRQLARGTPFKGVPTPDPLVELLLGERTTQNRREFTRVVIVLRAHRSAACRASVFVLVAGRQHEEQVTPHLL